MKTENYFSRIVPILFFLLLSSFVSAQSKFDIQDFPQDSLVLQSTYSGQLKIIHSGDLMKVWVNGVSTKGRLKSVDGKNLTLSTKMGEINFKLNRIDKIRVLYKGFWRGVSIVVFSAGVLFVFASVAYTVTLLSFLPEFGGVILSLLVPGIIIEGLAFYGVGKLFRGKSYYMNNWEVIM